MSAYTGIIIAESLTDKSILKQLNIINTKIEPVTQEHNTPHLKQWTLHTVQIPQNKMEEIANKLSKLLHEDWYADFKNQDFHYIIFRNKVFKINRAKPEEYKKVVEYGLSLGIPEYQLDFSPDIEEWQRNI